VIYSETLGIAYRAIPKCACTSVKWALNNALDLHLDEHSLHLVLAGNILAEQGAVTKLNGAAPADLFRFTIVRNPFDRLVSCYTDKVLQRHSGLDRRMYRLRKFPDFARAVCNCDPARANPHYRPMVEFFSVEQHFDLIARFENLTEDWRVIQKHSNIAVELPHTNPSKNRKPYREYYTPEIRGFVEKYYREDLERWGYEF